MVNNAKLLPPLGLEGPGEAAELVELRESGSHGSGVAGSCGLRQREAAPARTESGPGLHPAPACLLHIAPPRNDGWAVGNPGGAVCSLPAQSRLVCAGDKQ